MQRAVGVHKTSSPLEKFYTTYKTFTRIASNLVSLMLRICLGFLLSNTRGIMTMMLLWIWGDKKRLKYLENG